MEKVGECLRKISFLCYVFLLPLSSLSFGQSNLTEEIFNELINYENLSCTSKKVHLTFDDGPSRLYSRKILEVLKAQNVKATFFISTYQIKSPQSIEASIVKEIIMDGHLVGSHGHDHVAYDLRMSSKGEILSQGLSHEERLEQIKKSLSILDSSTSGMFSRQSEMLFRFPYGRGAIPSEKELDSMVNMTFQSKDFVNRLEEYRARSPALKNLFSLGLSHLGWDHDSQDTSFSNHPDLLEVKRYVKENIKRICKGKTTKVALFHDVKEINALTIDHIISIGKKLKMEFISGEEMLNDVSVKDSKILISGTEKKDSVGIKESSQKRYPYAELLENKNSPTGFKCYIYCREDQDKIPRIYMDSSRNIPVNNQLQCNELMMEVCKDGGA